MGDAEANLILEDNINQMAPAKFASFNVIHL